MELFIKREKNGINAKALYDIVSGQVTVLKGSIVSSTVAHSEKFRGAKSIENSRKEYVDGVTVTKDVSFKSSSTAANFVTGVSTNGLTAWKTESGETLKSVLNREG